MVKNKKKWSVTNIILTALIVILLGVVGYSGFKLFGMYQKYHHNTVSQNKVSEVFYGQQTTVEQEAQEGSAVTPTTATENPFTQEAYSLSSLVAQNPDTVGWINIPDTTVDFAVMQAADNDYYLHRDFFRYFVRRDGWLSIFPVSIRSLFFRVRLFGSGLSAAGFSCRILRYFIRNIRFFLCRIPQTRLRFPVFRL